MTRLKRMNAQDKRRPCRQRLASPSTQRENQFFEIFEINLKKKDQFS